MRSRFGTVSLLAALVASLQVLGACGERAPVPESTVTQLMQFEAPEGLVGSDCDDMVGERGRCFTLSGPADVSDLTSAIVSSVEQEGGVAQEIDCPSDDPFPTCAQVVKGSDGTVVVRVLTELDGTIDVFVAPQRSPSS